MSSLGNALSHDKLFGFMTLSDCYYVLWLTEAIYIALGVAKCATQHTTLKYVKQGSA